MCCGVVWWGLAFGLGVYGVWVFLGTGLGYGLRREHGHGVVSRYGTVHLPASGLAWSGLVGLSMALDGMI